MKSYLNLFIAAVMLVMIGCSPEVDDKFDVKASERVDKVIENYKSMLTDCEYGWAMDYYPGGSNLIYGGFALTMKFSKDGLVEVRSSYSGNPDDSAVSLYAFGRDMGATLNFVTYNRLFNIFSDPDLNIGEGISKGMMGDYEFQLGEMDGPDSFSMKGKKHRAVIRMRKLDMPAEDYIAKAIEQKRSYMEVPAVSGISGEINGKKISGEILNPQRFLLTDTEGNSVEVPFMFTAEGSKLYMPFTLAGETVESLIWDASQRSFSDEKGLMRLELLADPLGLTVEELLGNYRLTSGFGQDATVRIVRQENEILLKDLLPVDIKLKYNFRRGALEMRTQVLQESGPEVRLCMWDSDVDWLDWGNFNLGMVTKWNGDKDNFVLTFEHNGAKWANDNGPLRAVSFILWNYSAGRTWHGWGEGRYTYPVLTRIN